MSRAASNTDYQVDVEGVGNFSFGRRRMADEIKIQVEFSRLTEGVEPTPWLNLLAGWMADLKVLTVRAPEGWDIDEMDPLDQETYDKLFKVHSAFRAKEDSFRSGAKPASQAQREDAG